MELLRLITEDYKLTISANGVDKSFVRSSTKNLNLENSTQYFFKGSHAREFKIAQVVNKTLTNILTEANFNSKTYPVFFENKDYFFDIEFNSDISSEPTIYSPLKEVRQAFIPRKIGDKYLMTGIINYGNEIGKTSFEVNYVKGGKIQNDVIEYEVFPIKLDFKNDYLQIVKEINDEFSGLVLEYLTKTYSGFCKGDEIFNDIIWWQVFGGLYENILKSSKLILNKPHNRLTKDSYFSKADKIIFLTPSLEEKIAENRGIISKYYKVNRKILTTDTTENRFFKYALNQIHSKFKKLKIELFEKCGERITEEFTKRMNNIDEDLKKICNNHFFRQIGDFRGMKQESLVMQKASGYTGLFRDWIILKKGIEFYEGVNKIGLKSIEKLYQIWCFLKMKNIIKDILGKDPLKINLAEILIDNFTIQLRSGRKSKITFQKDNGDIIELFHEMKYIRGENDGNVSYTVSQEPDIVLKLSKSDLIDNYEFTYLYDAKYRLMSEEDKNYKGHNEEFEYPPDDAINQMHRYRDAIFYRQKNERPKKEVIGAYILFPGDNSKEETEKQYFQKSISEVNIGAFPLLPQTNKSNNFSLLQNHLRDIIGYSSDNIFVKEVLSQKEMKYEASNATVIVALVQRHEHIKYIKGNPEFSYLYEKDIKEIDKINSIRYYAPWIYKEGVCEYFECDNLSVKERREILPNHSDLKSSKTDPCYEFRLTKRFKLKSTIKPEYLNKSFKITTLSKLRKAKSFSEL